MKLGKALATGIAEEQPEAWRESSEPRKNEAGGVGEAGDGVRADGVRETSSAEEVPVVR
ncbi:hypothetical protein [Streptomyces sp. NPDC029554]|uniref:hypothetical protein n=1 Tax=Streptomyces sp. NPDC029554 TaxID=3155126 RepID=UPI0033E0B9EA